MIQTASKLRSLLAWSKTAGLPPDPTRAGRILDPLLRRYFTPEFADAMDNHVR